jgi:hypothetical protein
VDGAAKRDIRGELEAAGICERTVFPDLAHLAADLARDRYGPVGRATPEKVVDGADDSHGFPAAQGEESL